MSTQSCKNDRTSSHAKWRKKLFTLILLTIFGVIMFATKKVMEFLPNIHLLGMFVVLLTVVFRSRALISVYVYVFLDGAFSGFALWWLPYLYIWTVLWGMVMLLPRKMPDKVAFFVYPLICGFHGLIFGILYAPGEALLFGLSFKEMISWIAFGAVFDVIHAVSDFCMGFLVLPLSKPLLKMKKRSILG